MKSSSDYSVSKIDDEINIVAMVSLLWSKKLTLLYFILTFSISSLLLAFLTTNLYTSSSLLQVSQASNQSNLNSITSRYLDLASISGLGFSSGTDSSKKDLAIATLTSRDFFINILQSDPGIKAKIIAAKDYDHDTKKIIYESSAYDGSKWNETNEEPSSIEVHNYFIENVLKINVDKESNHIKLSVTHLSPLFAKELLEICIKELNLQLKKYDLEESSKAIKYLEDSLVNIKTNEIRNSINSLLEKQLEIQMLANIQDDYVLKVIDSPFEPVSKSYPSNFLFLIFGIFCGGFFGIIFIFVRDYIQND